MNAILPRQRTPEQLQRAVRDYQEAMRPMQGAMARIVAALPLRATIYADGRMHVEPWENLVHPDLMKAYREYMRLVARQYGLEIAG